MFERFTKSARDVVVLSQEQARTREDRHIGTEHLLLAMCVGSADAPLSRAFERHGITVASTESVLRSVTTTPEGTTADRDPLSVLGIDIEEIQKATESAFGRGALDRARHRNEQRRRRFGRARNRSPEAIHIPFTPGAKAALEDSLRIALRHKDSFICGAHLALAVATTDDGPAHDILTAPEFDLDLNQLRTDLTICINDR